MPLYSYMPSEIEKAQREELRARIDQLQGRRNAVKQMKAELQERGQRKSLPLPPELVAMIFDYYVHVYEQLPEKLLLVCQAWHVLALSFPTLWKNLDVLGQFGLHIIKPWAGTFLQSRIARSNPVPLDIDFSRVAGIDMPIKVMEKIAKISTLLPRIRSLVISRTGDIALLLSDQPHLKSLTIKFEYPPSYPVIPKAMLKKLNLAAKAITTLRFKYPPKPSFWPDTIIRHLHTLEVTTAWGGSVEINQAWIMIEKASTLRNLHITVGCGSPTALSHPSVQQLSLTYYSTNRGTRHYCLGEINIPHLQRINIDTSDPQCLEQLKLIKAPVSSLHLVTQYHSVQIGRDTPNDANWANSIITFLRTIPRVESVTLCVSPAASRLVADALRGDFNLCPALQTLSIEKPVYRLGSLDKGEQKRLLAKIARAQTAADITLAQRLAGDSLAVQ